MITSVMASTVDVAVVVVVDVAADVADDAVVVDVVIIPLQFFCSIYHGCTPIGTGGPLL